MAVTPSNIPSTPDPNEARDKHIQKFALPDVAKPGTKSAYVQLVEAMRHDGAPFRKWTEATNHYHNVLHETSQPGNEDGIAIRGQALHQLRLARIAYLAPLDFACAKAREGKRAPMLTAEEWDLLACSIDTTISAKTEPARSEAVEQFKKTTYPQYEGMITDDQMGRADSTVRGPSFSRIEKSAINLARGLWERDWSSLKYFSATEGERALAMPATKDEARKDLELSAKANAVALAEKEFDAAKTPPTQAEKDKRLAELTADEKKKITDDKIKERMEDIDAPRKDVREKMKAGRDGYEVSITDITANMRGLLQTLNEFQKDIRASNSDGKAPPIEDQTDLINETVRQATVELEKAIVHDYHHHARLYEQQFVGAGHMSRYGGKKSIFGKELTPIHAAQEQVSDAQMKILGGLDENAGKVDKDGKLDERKVLTVNGVPCARVGLIDMYSMDLGFSFMWHAWGGADRTQHIGKLFEAWIVELTDANQKDYGKLNPGGTLSREEMLTAYASGATLPDGTTNKNIGSNGQPINALRISTLPVRGGVESTCRAFAEMQAMAQLMGIAINIDTAMIKQNSEDSRIAGLVEFEWKSHFRIDDPTYGIPAMERVQKEYGIDPTWPPEKKKVVLLQKLAGNDIASGKALMILANKDPATVAALNASGSTSATTNATPSASAAAVTPTVAVIPAPSKTAAPVAPTLEFQTSATPTSATPKKK
ncbi:MAG: hypothetical protein ACHQAX_01870 [Gammaproteobacteria bacterium]